MSTILAIDPGSRGAIAAIDDSRLLLYPLPYRDDGVDVPNLLYTVRSYPGCTVCIEQPQMRSTGLSIASVATTFSNWGKIVGALEAISIPVIIVPVARWQAVIHPFAKPGIEDAKERSLSAANKLFPGEKFLLTPRARVPHDGAVDAALIGLWAKLTQK